MVWLIVDAPVQPIRAPRYGNVIAVRTVQELTELRICQNIFGFHGRLDITSQANSCQYIRGLDAVEYCTDSDVVPSCRIHVADGHLHVRRAAAADPGYTIDGVIDTERVIAAISRHLPRCDNVVDFDARVVTLGLFDECQVYRSPQRVLGSIVDDRVSAVVDIVDSFVVLYASQRHFFFAVLFYFRDAERLDDFIDYAKGICVIYGRRIRRIKGGCYGHLIRRSGHGFNIAADNMVSC